MTGMTRKPALFLAFTLGLLVVVAVGCGPSEQDLKIQDLSAENDQLKADLSDLDHQLNEILVRDGDAQEEINDLNRELAILRVDRDKVKDVDGWISTPTFDMISIADSVLFASGKADIKSTGRTKLAQLAADIRSRYADRDIYVIGHTDAQPIRKSKWKDNLQLGFARSATVVRTLGDLGLSRDKLIAASCGESRPIVADMANKSQARNRRVEIYAVVRTTGGMEEITARGRSDD